MENFFLQNYVLRVWEFVGNKTEKPVVKVEAEKVDGFCRVFLKKPVSGMEICVVGIVGRERVRVKSVVSYVFEEFFFIDMSPLVSSGEVYTENEDFFIGFVMKSTMKPGFSLGLHLFYYFPECSVPAPVEIQYPVYLVASAMQGSIVSLGRNLFITNAHVVKGSINAKISDSKKSYQGTVLKTGKILDLSLIHCDIPSHSPSILAKKFYEGEKIITVGFGISSKIPLVTHGFLSKIVYYQGFPILAMISAKTFNGQSGGGVFNSNQELIGIITANVENQTDKIYLDLGFCILNPVFSEVLKGNIGFNYLWEEENDYFRGLFNFQTTLQLPHPKI